MLTDWVGDGIQWAPLAAIVGTAVGSWFLWWVSRQSVQEAKKLLVKTQVLITTIGEQVEATRGVVETTQELAQVTRDQGEHMATQAQAGLALVEETRREHLLQIRPLLQWRPGSRMRAEIAYRGEVGNVGTGAAVRCRIFYHEWDGSRHYNLATDALFEVRPLGVENFRAIEGLSWEPPMMSGLPAYNDREFWVICYEDIAGKKYRLPKGRAMAEIYLAGAPDPPQWFEWYTLV